MEHSVENDEPPPQLSMINDFTLVEDKEDVRTKLRTIKCALKDVLNDRYLTTMIHASKRGTKERRSRGQS